MTGIPFCTFTHVTSKIYPRPRVLACVLSSATVLHKSLPRTDWHVVSQLQRAQPERVGDWAGKGCTREAGTQKKKTESPPNIFKGQILQQQRSTSLAPTRTAPPFPTGLLYRAATLRPRKEAYHHNRRPQSLRCTRDPTNNLPKRTGWHQGGKGGKVKGGEEIKEVRGGETQNGQQEENRTL